MTLTLDTNPRYGQLNFDPSYSSSASPPQFSDPWSAAPAPNTGNNLYVPGNNSHHHHQHHPQQHPHQHPHHQGLSPEMGLNLARQQAARQSTSSVSSSTSYGSMPVTTTSTGNASPPDAPSFQPCLPLQDFLALNRLPNVSAPQYGDAAYSASSSPVHAHYPPSNAPYDHLGYASTSMRSNYGMPPASDPARRFSQPLVPPFLVAVRFT